MRLVVRNSFARTSILSERVSVPLRVGQKMFVGHFCDECGGQRKNMRNDSTTGAWLYRFHEGQSWRTVPIAKGKLFCSRSCIEAYIGHSLDERKR